MQVNFNTDGRKYIAWLLGAYALFFVIKLALVIRADHPWVVGDWVINYIFGGFKRRGLAGTFIIWGNHYLGIPIKLPIFVAIWLIYTCVLFHLWKLLKQSALTLLAIFLFVNPVGFLFGMNNESAIARKDALIFLLFLWLLNKSGIETFKPKFIGLFCLAFVLSILNHEVILFFLPWFILGILYHSKGDIKLAAPFIASLCTSSVLTAFVLFSFGKQIYSPETNSYLLSLGLKPNVLDGILTFSVDFDAWAYILEVWVEYGKFFITLLIGLVPWVILHFASNQLTQGLKFVRILFANILLSSALFYMAIDWGRWLHIHYMLMLFYAIKVSGLPHDFTYLVKARLKAYLPNLAIGLCLCIALFIKMPNCDHGLQFRTIFVAALRYAYFYVVGVNNPY